MIQRTLLMMLAAFTLVSACQSYSTQPTSDALPRSANASNADRNREVEWTPEDLASLDRIRSSAARADVLAVYSMVDIPDGSVRYDHKGTWKGSIDGRPYDRACETVRKHDRDAIADLLFRADHYEPSPTRLGFHADIGFRFHGNGRNIAVVFDGNTNKVVVTEEGVSIKLLNDKLSRDVGERLVAIAHQALVP